MAYLVMTQRCLFGIGGVVALRAGNISIPADFGTCGCLCCMCHFVMAVGIDDPAILLDLMLTCSITVVVLASRAVPVSAVAIFSTGSCLSCGTGNGAGVSAFQNGDLGVLIALFMADGAFFMLNTGIQNGCFLIGDPLPVMSQSRYNGIGVAVITTRADMGGVTVFCTGRTGYAGNIAVTQSIDFHIGGVVAARAGLICIPTDLGTGSSLSLMLHFVVTQSIDFHIGGVVAARAGLICIPTDLGTSGSLCFMLYFVVTQSIDFLIGGVVAARAGHICIPADLGTSRSLCFMLYFVMAQSCNQFCTTYSTSLGIGTSCLSTGGVTQCVNSFLRNGHCVTDRAVLALSQTGFGTSGSLSCVNDLGMTQGGNTCLSNQHFATDGAVLALSQTGFGTGGSLSCVNDLGVTQSVNGSIGVAVATVLTSMGGVTSLSTSGRNYRCFIAVTRSCDLHSLGVVLITTVTDKCLNTSSSTSCSGSYLFSVGTCIKITDTSPNTINALISNLAGNTSSFSIGIIKVL